MCVVRGALIYLSIYSGKSGKSGICYLLLYSSRFLIPDSFLTFLTFGGFLTFRADDTAGKPAQPARHPPLRPDTAHHARRPPVPPPHFTPGDGSRRPRPDRWQGERGGAVKRRSENWTVPEALEPVESRGSLGQSGDGISRSSRLAAPTGHHLTGVLPPD